MGVISRTIWANVEDLRQINGWTMMELARRSGITPQHLNAIRTGIKGIGEKNLERFSQALEVPAEDLLKLPQQATLDRIARALERIAEALEGES